MNERELIIFKLITPTLDLHEKYFILVNMFYTVEGSIIHNVINFCFMKGTSNRLLSIEFFFNRLTIKMLTASIDEFDPIVAIEHWNVAGIR